MIDLLNFAFRSGWHFAGCTLWLVCICSTVGHASRWTPISIRKLTR